MDLRAAVASVVDPQLDLALGDVGMLGEVGDDRVEVRLPIDTWPTASLLRERVADAARAAGAPHAEVVLVTMDEPAVREVRAALRARMAPSAAGGHGQGHAHGQDHGDAPTPAFLERGSATRVLGVSSGKGGVGKSTVSVNLAIALARQGHRVGVLDADVYGFSVPKMVLDAAEPVVLGDTVVPTYADGVRWLSMGWFVDDDQPVIWRGPLLHKAISQFVTEAWWGEPDYLVVDMPPGTGDVALTLSQVVPSVEVLVVTTPQPAAQRVAQRSALAARKLRLAVRGVVENMSWFDAGGARHELFGRGGGAALAETLGVPLLGQLPFVEAVREAGDVGRPVVATDPTSEAAGAFEALAGRIAAQGPARVYRQELRLG